ncbi:ABC transporter substrate-binding protein [Thermosphaera chiliense]|uniref:ABC transporter substrate-binding protein n=1 Tax=Thermosphaera chiliense TaxID=3402707 RepID=UPI001D0A16C0|nr:ABC transporter substrate-binding protein [Thermosphaera aggregans]
MQPQEILTGLVGGYIDVAILPEPYPEVAESKGLMILLLSSEVWPDMPGSYLFTTVDYLEKNRDVLRIIADLVGEMVDEVEEDPSKAVETLSKWLDISGDDALRAIQRIQWNTSLDGDQIQAYIDFAYSKRVIKERYNATLLVESV